MCDIYMYVCVYIYGYKLGITCCRAMQASCSILTAHAQGHRNLARLLAERRHTIMAVMIMTALVSVMMSARLLLLLTVAADTMLAAVLQQQLFVLPDAPLQA